MLVFFLLLLSPSLYAREEIKPKIHALIFVPDAKKDSKDAFILDGNRFSCLVRQIAKHLDLDCHIRYLSGESCTLHKIDEWIKDISNTDISIFYYSSHGFHEKKDKTIFPTIHDSRKHIMPGSRIARYLHKARMGLMILDCCNAFPEYRSLFDINVQLLDKYISKSTAQRLFVDFRGTVLASACSVREYAYFCKEGSIFSMNFQVHLSKAGPYDSWYTILRNTKNACMIYHQNPSYLITRK